MEHNTDWREMRELIKRTGLTQDKIAQELGVSLRTVSYLGSDKLTRGKQNVTHGVGAAG